MKISNQYTPLTFQNTKPSQPTKDFSKTMEETTDDNVPLRKAMLSALESAQSSGNQSSVARLKITMTNLGLV